MKAIIYFTMAVTLLVTGCNKPSPAPGAEQYDRYIFFSQNVETRAGLVESASSIDQFGVVGFKYENSTTWNSYKTDAVLNVFYDEDGELLEGAETVYCDDNGYGDYSPLQGWSNTRKYTFFAYYPLNDNVSLVNTDGTEYTGGVPAIRYAMNTADLKGSMVDVMTAASAEDLYWNSSSDNNIANAEVGFTFTHRLSSLGVNVKNSSSGIVTVNSVTLKVSGISYQEIIIPLDGSAVEADGTSMDADLSLTLADGDKSVAKSGQKEMSDKLIFIPQTSGLSVQVVVGYKRENTDTYTGYTDTITLPEVTTALTAGKKHMINLNFTDSTVEAQVTVDGWVDMEDVYDTFN
ncbi:MAG: fimbrillin family protein [Bacteroidales bacterium]|nr:fimbrillin family protein [Bacteroidales bacterium]